jgi:SagB-type dehydrogenase family enzyme
MAAAARARASRPAPPPKEPAVPASLVLSLQPDVIVADGVPTHITVQSPRGGLALPVATPGLRAALRSLAGDGLSEDQLANEVMSQDGPAQLAALYFFLDHLGGHGLLRYTAEADERALATLEPVVPGFPCLERRAVPGKRYTLSRFALLRRDGTRMLLETPLAGARLILHDWRGPALIGRLVAARTVAELCEELPGVSDDAAAALLGLLLRADMAGEAGEDGSAATDVDGALAQWEFHDLLFQSRSRMGRHGGPYGGTYRFRGVVPPLPAVKPPPATGEPIPLARPDVERLAETDVPFTRVLETRRSIRDNGDEPLTVAQLGEFLYRTARLKRLVHTDSGELGFYPYPNGGASSELVLYLAVDSCRDLASGLYRYDPAQHYLYAVAERTPAVERLLHEAAQGAARQTPPQVLIVIAARFRRVSWKYESMAYALILKHVGVVIAHMYLVATAMGLAPCALGGGHSDLFTLAAGTSYYAETSVGEFILGSLKGVNSSSDTCNEAVSEVVQEDR